MSKLRNTALVFGILGAMLVVGLSLRPAGVASANPVAPFGFTLTPTETATPVTPTATPETPTATPETPTATPETPTATPESPTFTPQAPPPEEEPPQDILLPVTGEVGPSSAMSLLVWPAMAAILLLGLALRIVWAGILQAEPVRSQVSLQPSIRAEARKAMILIMVSLAILTLLLLPSILKERALDLEGLGAVESQLVANISHESVEPPASIEIEPDQVASSYKPPSSTRRSTLGEEEIPVEMASAATASEKEVQDTGGVVRLVIPALKVDSRVRPVPFDGATWDIEGLGTEVAWLGNTSSPGLGSNTVLAGHVTVLYYGNGPFRRVYRLQQGDQLLAFTNHAVYTFAVREQKVVTEDDASVTAATDEPQLTLLTCTNWNEEEKKYMSRRAVLADLVSVSPLAVGFNNPSAKE